jgi:hypothetical protein
MTVRATNLTSQRLPDPKWPEAQARVTACKYQFARLNTLTLGIPTDSNPFLITFSYHVQGKTYTSQFTSPTYLEQDHLFSVSYNPLRPQQNTKSGSSPTTRTPLFAIAVVVSILLCVAYLVALRGCN